MSAPEVHTAALAAIAARRELLAAGTVGPWEHVRVPFRDTASHTLKRDERVLGFVGWEKEEPERSPADAALIVAATNAFAADTDALEAVLLRHAPMTVCPTHAGCVTGPHCGKCRTTAWPCPDAQATLTALGVPHE